MKLPNIDPVFLSIGPLQFRWYGLMYLLSFAIAFFVIASECSRKQLTLSKDDVANLLFYGAMGVVIGGRLGYILFYNLEYYINNPFKLLAVWEGGMSFHGGFIGVMIAFYLFSKLKNLSFWILIDIAALCAPIGLGLGRIGNFINGELYGRHTDLPWGIIFPGADAGPLPRHPSQLYEAILEGLVLFLLIKLLSRKWSTTGIAGWTFVAGYGLFRFIVEFFREPDAQIGLFMNIFSMGQLLSFPMFLVGTVAVIVLCRRSRHLTPP